MEDERYWQHMINLQKTHDNRAANIRQRFKITPEYYDFIVEQQRGVCATCRRPARDKYGCTDGEYLSVDINKKTGKVRGLLCRFCKTAITLLQSDPATFRAIAGYLDAPAPATPAPTPTDNTFQFQDPTAPLDNPQNQSQV